MNARGYYVYEHWRPDKNVCFYVGKGKAKRAWDLANMRNRHFKAVVSKLTSMGLCVDVRIVIENISEETALRIEIDRIAMYGREHLTNMTRGGDGLVSPSAEVRAKMSASQKKRFSDHPEQLVAMSERRKGRITSEETKSKLRLTRFKHSDQAIVKMRAAAKIRGISKITRIAQKLAVTGRKRAPFTPDTILKMKVAAKAREALKKLVRIA